MLQNAPEHLELENYSHLTGLDQNSINPYTLYHVLILLYYSHFASL
jgi:hypothetical protein